MKKVIALTYALVTGLAWANQADAAAYEYTFQENIVAFPFSMANRSQIDTEWLSTPYASIVIADAPDGLDMNIKIDKSFAGWLQSIYFDYIPKLDVSRYIPGSSGSTPPADQPYYYSSPDGVSGLGTSYSIQDWQPSSTLLTFSYGNPFGESVSIHFRNLPSEISAATFTPEFLAVRSTPWGKASDTTAYVLASPVAAVPEPTSAGLLCMGFALVVLATKNRSLRPSRRS